MSFIIKAKSGTYRVYMRGAYVESITSEKKLKAAIQRGIDHYRSKGTDWFKYADRMQQLLDDKDYMRISSDWGLFSQSQKV